MEQGETRRDAILEAMIRVTGSKGYPATSVADVLAEAGTSRTTFYKHFDNKRECFLAAYDLAFEKILGAAETACAEGGSWPDRARRGLRVVVELLSSDRPLAQTAIVEVSAAGAEARRRHSAAIARLAELLDSGAPPRPEGEPELPPNTALMTVGAVTGLILDQLRQDRASNLSLILPELEFALLVPYLGPRIAAGGFAEAAST
ncbi:MAG: TetR/AcrR family transcriptional regulator [Solirubrobacterales bacterium]